MKLTRIAVSLIALVTAACSGATVSPTAVPSSPAAATASPTIAPTILPTAAPTASPSSRLEGTWATGETTCAQQQAAVEAGFTAEQLASVGWSPDCPGAYTIRFAERILVEFGRDGSMGWEGNYRIVDEDTFEAGNFSTGCYISYDYAIDGDQLTIDMVQDICPGWSDAEVLGDSVAQTEIYETSPFTRQN